MDRSTRRRQLGIGAIVVAALAITSGVAWSAHLIGGAFVVAASIGGLVGLLATLPGPATDA